MKYFVLTYSGKPFGESGESCKTSYNFDYACDVCGTGANIDGELHTKGINRIEKDFFQTLDGDFIISAKLHREIIAEKLKIGKLKSIVDYKNNVLPFYHLYTELNLPRAIEIKGLVIEDQCPICKMNGYFNQAIVGNLEKNAPTRIFPLELTYKSVNLSYLNQSDIFNTWEHMGLSNRKEEGKRIVRYARPLLVVSERIKGILEKNNMKELQFEVINLG